MDKLLQSAERYFDILKRCSSPEVGSWKTEDLDRAFHWADHFNKMYGRIVHKPSVVQKFDAQLRGCGQRLGFRFGREEFGFEFLGHSLKHLIKALLENPILPSTLREKILQQYASGHHVHKHLEDFSSDGLLLEKLSAMHAKLMECRTKIGTPLTGTTLCQASELRVVDAICLRETIMWYLEHSPGHRLDDAAQKQLDGLLQQENGMEVILLALVRPSEEIPVDDCATAVHQTQTTILQWLLQKAATNQITNPGSQQSVAERLWREPPKLLAQVSKQHLEFFQAHVRHLVLQVNALGQSQQAYVPTSEVGTEQQFNEIVCHFQELIMSGDGIKELCTSLVESKLEGKGGHYCAGVAGTLDLWRKLRLRLST